MEFDPEPYRQLSVHFTAMEAENTRLVGENSELTKANRELTEKNGQLTLALEQQNVFPAESADEDDIPLRFVVEIKKLKEDVAKANGAAEKCRNQLKVHAAFALDFKRQTGFPIQEVVKRFREAEIALDNARSEAAASANNNQVLTSKLEKAMRTEDALRLHLKGREKRIKDLETKDSNDLKRKVGEAQGQFRSMEAKSGREAIDRSRDPRTNAAFENLAPSISHGQGESTRQSEPKHSRCISNTQNSDLASVRTPSNKSGLRPDKSTSTPTKPNESFRARHTFGKSSKISHIHAGSSANAAAVVAREEMTGIFSPRPGDSEGDATSPVRSLPPSRVRKLSTNRPPQMR